MGARMSMTSDRFLLAWRIGGVIACAALAWGALVNAFADAGRARTPAAVLRFIPSDAGARANFAERLMDRLAEPKIQAQIADLIHGSLTYDALNPKALRLRGFVAEAEGDHATARRFNQLAERASRRDAGAQIWMIEDRVAANDIAGALRHYDTALSTVSKTDALLFPILANALSDPAIRKAFLPIFRADREWEPSFMSYWIGSRSDPGSAAELVIAAGGFPNPARYGDLGTGLMLALADAGEFDPLRRLYEILPGATPDGVRRADFAAPLIDGHFAPVAWRLMNGPDYGASFRAGGDDAAVLDASAATGGRGTVARKLIYPGQGPKIVRAPVRFTNSSSGGAVTLAAQCLEGKKVKTAARSRVERSGQLALSIPADSSCDAYYLDIGIIGGTDESGLEAEVGSLTIAPAPNA
jgi:hypothetical protein